MVKSFFPVLLRIRDGRIVAMDRKDQTFPSIDGDIAAWWPGVINGDKIVWIDDRDNELRLTTDGVGILHPQGSNEISITLITITVRFKYITYQCYYRYDEGLGLLPGEH